jgi:hypothetical protein
MHPILSSILGLLTLFIVLVSIRYGIQLYQNKNVKDKKTNDSKAIMEKGFEIGYLGEKKKLEQKKAEQKPVEQKPVEPIIEEKKYIKGNDNWKYTKDDNDIDCLINWNYYDSDKKTIIQKSIPRVTTLDRNNKWCATKNNTSPTDRQIQQSGVKKVLDENKGMLIGIASKTVVVKASKKLLSSAAGKAIQKKILNKLKTKIISKIGFKMQAKFLTKIAKNVSKNVATKLAKSMAFKIGKTAGKSAAKFGLKASTKMASMAARLRPSPTIVFEILSMGLDMGDAGGYAKMQSKEALYKLKSETEKNLKKGMYENIKMAYQEHGETLKEEDFIWPVVYDPLENATDTFDDLLNKKIETIMADPNNSFSKPIFDAIDNDLESGKITQEQLDKDEEGELLNSYIDNLLNTDEISKIVYEDWCKSKDGIIYDNDKCTLPEKTCTVWPIKKDKDGNPETAYREFRDGKCIIVDSSVREKCDEMNIPYDMQTGMCKIDEKYCKSKGAEWRQNKKINNEYDCAIPLEQKIFESIFGTTVTRGLKQIFDPDQYKSCGFDGPIKIRNKCLDLPNGNLDNGNKLQVWDCNNSLAQNFYYNSTDETVRSISNYEKCFDLENGKTDPGTLVQIYNCNNSDAQKFLYDDKTKQFKLKKDETKCLDLINDNNNNGTKIQVSNCKDHQAQKFEMKRNRLSDAGLTCDIATSRVADCPPGYTNNGLTCGRSASSKTSDFGLGKFESADCPPGYYNDGTNCTFKLFTTPSDKWYSKAFSSHATDMKNCEKKWGKGNCEAVGVSGSKKALYKCSLQAKDKGYANWEHWGPDDGSPPFCSPYKGWRQFSLKEAGKCPPSNDKSKKYTNRTGALCYVNCEKEYGPGWYNNGTQCFRDVSTKGLDSMTCNPDERMIGGRCYPKCPPDYTNMGLTCHRRKYRKIALSTKKN